MSLKSRTLSWDKLGAAYRHYVVSCKNDLFEADGDLKNEVIERVSVRALLLN
jgi:hypothetical protein